MNEKSGDNFSEKERLEAQKALGGEKVEKQLAEEERARKLKLEQARNKKIQEAEEARAALRKKELVEENKSWQKKIHANKAEPTPAPKPAPKDPTPVKAEKSHDHRAEIPTLRTFQDDVAKAVRAQKESVTTIALAEQKKRRAQKESGHQSELAKAHYRTFPVKRIIIGLGGILVFISLAGGMFSLLQIWNNAPNTDIPAEELLYAAPLGVSDQEAVSLDKETILGTIVSKTNDAITPTTFKDLVFLDPDTESRINAQKFLSSWAHTMPELLARTLRDTFFVGVYAPVSSKNELALIFNIKSPEQALAGMLAWEETLPEDLASLYLLPTSLDEQFRDTIFRTTDARVLRDEEGRIRIGYAILENTLVISTGSAALDALIEAEPSF